MPTDDLYPEMPEWFREYLRALPKDRRDELFAWVNHEESDCALDMISEALDG